MYHAQPGDMIIVNARGDMSSGVFGEGRAAVTGSSGSGHHRRAVQRIRRWSQAITVVMDSAAVSLMFSEQA